MSATLYRATEADISTDGRTLEGRAVYLDRTSRVVDPGGMPYRESFARNAFKKSIQERAGRRFPLMMFHPLAPGARTSPVPLGAVDFVVGQESLDFQARVSETVAGTEALALLADGAIGDVSIGFRPIKAKRLRDADGDYVMRTEVGLIELSLAPVGLAQHEGAQVLAVRSQANGTPRLDALRRRRGLLVTP